MAVGNGKSHSESWHGKAEYFDVDTDSWTIIDSYGVTSDGGTSSVIYSYASVYSNGYFYIIGGWREAKNEGSEAQHIIYKLDSQTWKWSIAGEMKNKNNEGQEFAEHSAAFVKTGLKSI